jgi:beta-lactamase superfamily II metal-dependent hydrolase
METSNEAGSVRIKNFVMPRIAKPDENYVQLKQTAKENGVTVSYIEKGNCIKVGNLELKCLHPYDGFATDEANDYSTVLSLHYKDFSMLFTGDVSNEGEKALIENEELGHHTVYKVAHSTMDYGAVCIQSDGIKTDIFGYCDKDSYLFPKNTKKMTILLK